MSGWWLLPAVLVGVYAIALLEEWSLTGRLAPGAPLMAGLARVARGSVVPR